MALNFQELTRIKNELKKIAEKQIPALSLFHITSDKLDKKEITKFQHFLETDFRNYPITGNPDISITSSVTCIKSLVFADKSYKANFKGFIEALNVKFTQKGKDKNGNEVDGNLSTTGLYHGNPFTVGLLLPILKKIEISENEDAFKTILNFCIENAKEHLSSGGISFPSFPKHGYLTYYNLIGLSESGIDVTEVCKESLQWSRDELFKQISYFEANDEEEADVFQLGYNLLIQYVFCRSALRESIVDLCLRIIFNSQLKRGVWEKKTPLFNYAQKGDAFPFSFELLNAIFKEFDGNEDKLIPYEEYLQAAFDWTKKNAKIERITYKDKEIDVQLWKSVSRQENVLAESWATSEVYLFLFYYKNYISRRIQKIVLNEFDGKNYNRPNEKAFSGLALPKISFSNELGEINLDTFLIEKVLNPLKNENEAKFSLANKPRKGFLARSGILFGPPGTGKTTYAKSIAKYLGWPLVIVNPSDFAKEGIALMPRMATEIFTKLIELEDTVIFFDEMEGLIKSRDDKDTMFEQQFLTTTFLPKLQTLHDKSTSIFLVATNYLNVIDPAAQREGRFDFKIQVLPPSIEAKFLNLSNALIANNLQSHFDSIKAKLEAIEDIVKYSTRKEFERLINRFTECRCDAEKLKKHIADFKNNILLKDKIDELKTADKQNTLDSD